MWENVCLRLDGSSVLILWVGEGGVMSEAVLHCSSVADLESHYMNVLKTSGQDGARPVQQTLTPLI